MIGDHYKSWAPHVTCIAGCSGLTVVSMKDSQSQKLFHWWDPNQKCIYVTDCYFCMSDRYNPNNKVLQEDKQEYKLSRLKSDYAVAAQIITELTDVKRVY